MEEDSLIMNKIKGNQKTMTITSVKMDCIVEEPSVFKFTIDLSALSKNLPRT